MKIVIVSTHCSHPTNAGNRSAIMAQVSMLKELGHDVHFLFADMSLRKTSDLAPMREYWGDRFHYFNQNSLLKLYRYAIDLYRERFCGGYWKCDDHYPTFLSCYLKKLNRREHFDAIIVQYMRLSKLLAHTDIPRRAIFTHDVFSYKDMRVGEPFYETCRADQEAKAMQRCPNIFAIQEEESVYYRFIAPHSRVYTVYSPCHYHAQPVVGGQNVLYLASEMEFNVTGIQWFLDNVWEQVLSVHPQARLVVGGSVCRRIAPDRYPQVELQGFVDSLEAFYAQGNVVINPVYQGTGLKIKTFEALAYGKTTLVHTHSSVGIYRRDTAPFVASDDAGEWVAQLSEMLSPAYDHAAKSRQAKAYIDDMYNYIAGQYCSFLSEGPTVARPTERIPRVIHYCWFGGAPKSPLIQQCIATWRRVMPDYEIKEWNETNFDIQSVPFVREAYASRKWAFIADYVRLYALYTEGGIYMDTDVKVLRRFDPFLRHGFFSCQESHPEMLKEGVIDADGRRNPEAKYVYGVGICSAVMGAERGIAYLKDCLDYYRAAHFDSHRAEDYVIVNIIARLLEPYGYRYITDRTQYLRGDIVIMRPYVFAGMTTHNDQSYALHLYNGSWIDDKAGIKYWLRNNFPTVYTQIQHTFYHLKK